MNNKKGLDFIWINNQVFYTYAYPEGVVKIISPGFSNLEEAYDWCKTIAQLVDDILSEEEKDD
jgi:hypothetical protein